MVDVGFDRICMLCTVTLFSPPPSANCPLWKEVVTCSPHFRSGELRCPSLRVEPLKSLGMLLHRRFVSSPIFINLFHLLFMSAWIHKYSFSTLGYKPTLIHYFVVQNVCFDHWELVQLLLVPASLSNSSIIVCVGM